MNKNVMILLLIAVVLYFYLVRGGAQAIGGQIMTNEETITWTDIEGKERTMTITRNVKLQ